MAKYEGSKETMRALAAYTNLVRATDSIVGLLTKQLDSFGLTMGQFRVLEAVLHVGPMSQSALCEKLMCSDGNMTFLIRKLMGRGLILRETIKGENIKWTIHLSPAGQKLIAKVFPQHARVIRARMAALKSREQETLRNLCRKLGYGNPGRFLRELVIVEE
jgi:MarR family transcriptional regulator, 2-MHQ and catechol-resistance regulon repressor